jgi:hypothetical protein
MAIQGHSSSIGSRLQPRRIPLGSTTLKDRLWTIVNAHPLAAAAVIIAFAFFEIQMTIIAANALARPVGFADPFAAHEAIAPGQSASGLAQYGCDLQSDMWVRGGSTTCRADGQVNGLMLVSANSNNRQDIHQLSFRASNVYVGNLVERWGYPDSVKIRNGLYYASWDEGVTAYVDPVSVSAEFIDLLPVVLVVVERS